jgi:hypothetical protein
MIGKNEILSKLNPYLNSRRVIVEDQGVSDIVNGILDTHQKYKIEYDKISNYFYGGDCYSTAKNIWNYLKENVTYFIEPDDKQTLRSPSAILAVPGDCKSYALFANGIIDSLRRKGLLHCEVAYRFAGYTNNKDFEHVFSVIKNGNIETWIDPVLPQFNQKKQPTNYKDKKINMALIAFSGIGDLNSSLTNLTTAATSIANPISASLKTIETLTALFASKPSPNDWLGWDAQDRAKGQWVGSSVRGYILNDGDNVQNEALNIVSYIKAKGIQNLVASGHPVTIEGVGWRDVTFDEIAAKLARGGFGQEATNIKNAYFFNLNQKQPQNDIPPTQAATSIPISTQGQEPKKAGMNMWIILALVAGGIYAISKNKR